MKFCPGCGRDESLYRTCGRERMPCPALVEADPAKHVTLKCGPCDILRVVPVEAIMKGKAKVEGGCQRDVCQAVVVTPSWSGEATLRLPPLGEAPGEVGEEPGPIEAAIVSAVKRTKAPK